MEIDIDEYEELKMRIMDLEDENKSLKKENSALAGFSGKVSKPFIEAGVSPEQFDEMMSNCEDVELVEIPSADPLVSWIGIKIRYKKRA